MAWITRALPFFVDESRCRVRVLIACCEVAFGVWGLQGAASRVESLSSSPYE